MLINSIFGLNNNNTKNRINKHTYSQKRMTISCTIRLSKVLKPDSNLIFLGRTKYKKYNGRGIMAYIETQNQERRTTVPKQDKYIRAHL